MVVAPDGALSFVLPFLLWLLLVVVAVVAVVVVVVAVVALAFASLSFPLCSLTTSASILSSDVGDVLVDVADGLTWAVCSCWHSSCRPSDVFQAKYDEVEPDFVKLWWL